MVTPAAGTMAMAGVGRANGVVAALTDDRDNLFVVLSARVHNPKARIVAKVIDGENESKMLRAGADQTVSPHRIGGLRMASELVRPKVTEFLDRMLRVRQNLRFALVAPASPAGGNHARRQASMERRGPGRRPPRSCCRRPPRNEDTAPQDDDGVCIHRGGTIPP